MSTTILTINADRFTRQKQSISGDLKPSQLARLKPFLADEVGEIHYALTGSDAPDAAGRRIRRLKCIISGWVMLVNPVLLEPQRYDLRIPSSLVLVGDEAELPPLEEEAPGEDYVALGEEINVLELVEEEILLDLPLWAIAVDKKSKKVKPPKKLISIPKSKTELDLIEQAVAEKKPSPFAKLAALKKPLALKH